MEEECLMAIEAKARAPFHVRGLVRTPKENDCPPAWSGTPARDDGIRSSQGILHGVLIGSLLWVGLILLGVVLW